MTQLTEQFHLPDEYHDACDRLTALVQKHAQRLLAEEYWRDEHLDAISDHSGQSYTYIRATTTTPSKTPKNTSTVDSNGASTIALRTFSTPTATNITPSSS
ncbi:hypothetical protein [Natronomonas pharaonis]|uniref:hypothetical protein n=1 Tax=Natronomonas pharaonis TaxID=2257 RepID=UPI00005B9361|nr:hypothetical protein [Natronomonas pharaonis]